MLSGVPDFSSRAQILRQDGPNDLQVVLVEARLELRQRALVLRCRRSAFSGDFGCDSLRKLAQRAVVDQQREF